MSDWQDLIDSAAAIVAWIGVVLGFCFLAGLMAGLVGV